MKKVFTQLVMLIGTGVVSLTSTGQSLTDSLLLHYDLNGGTTDQSGNGLDGTNNGANSTEDRFGRADGAFEFDGTSHIEIPEDTILEAGFPVTVATWFNVSDSSSISNRLVSLDGSAYYGYWLSLDPNNPGKISMSFGNGNPNTGAGPKGARNTGSSSSKVTSNAWHHVVAVVRGKNDMSMYIDGEAQSLTYDGTASTVNFSNTPGAVGANAGLTHFLAGSVGEVRVWKREISAAEATTLFKEETEVFHYKLDNNGNDDGRYGIFDLTQNGGPVAANDRFDSTGAAFQFDGIDDYMEIPHSDSIKTGFPVSFSLWFNVTDSSSNANRFLSVDGSAYYGYWVNMDPNNPGKFSASFGNGNPNTGAGPKGARNTCRTTGLVSSNEWHHAVVIIRGKNNMDVYIDSIQQALTYDGTASTVNFSAAAGVIGTNPGFNYFSESKLDDIRMWNREITTQEIAALYTRPMSVGVITSIQEESETVLQFFPNPANDQLIVKNANRFDRLELYALTGQRVLSIEGSSTYQLNLDLSPYQPGIYILQGATKHGTTYQHKLVIR